MRCCLRPTLVAAAATAACLLVSADAAASERVLVVGADASLVHEAVASSATPRDLATRFSPAGLAQLAMDSLGLPTGSLVHLSSDPSATAQAQLLVQSPVQADVFSRVDAYAMVFVDTADADVLSEVDAAAISGYHKSFELTPDTTAGPSTKIPAVIANALTNTVGARAQCAGSDLVCAGKALPAVAVADAQLQSVLEQYAFLDAAQSADLTFAKELAQTQQLTAAIAANKKSSPTAFFTVNFNGVAILATDKQTHARSAIVTEVQALLTALQHTYPRSSGAQVVATSRAATGTSVSVNMGGGVAHAAASPSVTVDSIVAYSRMLLSFNEKIGSASLGEDDDDDDDDDVGAATNGTKSDITIDDIAEYQIVLWTSVLLGAVLVLVLMAMCNMNTKRDSLLYAKFTTSNSGRKFD